jgi:hypothetical protein
MDAQLMDAQLNWSKSERHSQLPATVAEVEGGCRTVITQYSTGPSKIFSKKDPMVPVRWWCT